MGFIFEDTGLKKFEERLLELKATKVQIGYFEADGKEIHPNSDVSVAKLAAIIEFGTDDAPPHSFMQRAVEEDRSAIAAAHLKAVTDVLTEKRELAPALSEVATMVVASMRKKMTHTHETHTLQQNLGWKITNGRNVLARGN